MRPEWPGRTAQDISKTHVMTPESHRVSRYCFEKLMDERVEERLFAENVIELWQEKSRDVIDFNLDVNPGAVEVFEYFGDYFAVTHQHSQHVEEIMSVFDYFSADRFKSVENFCRCEGNGNERLQDEYGVENETDVDGDLICVLNEEFQREISRSMPKDEVTTYHGEFPVTHFCPLDINPSPDVID